jgi:hypothetical protein
MRHRHLGGDEGPCRSPSMETEVVSISAFMAHAPGDVSAGLHFLIQAERFGLPGRCPTGRGPEGKPPIMGTSQQYRQTAWDCLRLAEGTANPGTRMTMLDLSQHWVRLAEEADRSSRYPLSGYRAKAYECASRAESINDPERRADMLRYAGMWLSLTEPIDDSLRGGYELPSQRRAA